MTLLGARSQEYIIPTFLNHVSVATDDGSLGFRGTVVDLLRAELARGSYLKPKIFACGPSAMLRSLSNVAKEYRVPCEVSLESAMACGVGLCQGCPVEREGGEKKYTLVCKEGPVFDCNSIRV